MGVRRLSMAVVALAAAGHAVQTPTDVAAWMRQVRGAVVVLTVRAEADWAVLAEAAEIGSTAASLVVLLEEGSTAAGVRAVRAGARSVLARQASAEVLRRTVSAVFPRRVDHGGRRHGHRRGRERPR